MLIKSLFNLFLWQKGYLVQKLLKVVEIIGEVFVEAWFLKFPDDLEILKLDVRSYVDRSKGIIQIRSAARLGQSDLGVNLRRVEYLFNQLEKF